MSHYTIFHNPACGTSRNVLAMLRNAGIEPAVVQYLKTPLDRDTVRGLLAAMAITPRALLRRKGTPYDELGLDDPSLSDERLIELMVEHPMLIERPIVVSPRGTRLCRPADTVGELLP